MIANLSSKFLLLSSLSILLSLALPAQNATGKIVAQDTVKLEVIRLFPDSFPNVSVIFRASAPNGHAIYNLDSLNVHVTENDLECKVVSVKRISKDWAVNTALVVDHSGSMRMDHVLRKHWDSLPAHVWKTEKRTMRQYTNGEVDSDSTFAVRVAPADPVWYHSPLWYAQHAATSYVNKTDPVKDKNSLIGFSTDVDVTIPLTSSQSSITNNIYALEPTGETAFYDAVKRAIDEADKGDGIRVVIAMTDGKDNNSRESLGAVIAKSKAKNIPVYVIGLGDVDQNPLKRLARETGGLSYFTNDASTLSDIYKRITLEIQSIYELIYESPSMSMNDTARNCQLIFDVDSKYFSSRSLPFVLPKEVVERINEREKQLALKALPVDVTSPVPNTEIPWGLVGIGVTVLAAGVLSVRYMNRKKKPTRLEIVNLYPNPTSGPLTVVLNNDPSLTGCNLIIRSQSGTEVFRTTLAGGLEHTVDISVLDSGSYLVNVATGVEAGFSKTVIVTK